MFFGEDLPKRFFAQRRVDLAAADLLITMGTSLVVHPFAGLTGASPPPPTPPPPFPRKLSPLSRRIYAARSASLRAWWHCTLQPCYHLHESYVILEASAAPGLSIGVSRINHRRMPSSGWTPWLRVLCALQVWWGTTAHGC